MRIALLTLAVPWSDRPTNGLYNVSQASALRKLGHETEIFSVAPRLPRFAERLGGPFRRQLARPESYSFDGVPIHTVRGPVAYPRALRVHIGPRAPRLLARAFCAAVYGPLSLAINRFQPDAILAHGLLPWAQVLLRMKSEWLTRAAVIEHSQEDVTRMPEYPELRRYYREVSDRLDAILVVNDSMRSVLQSEGVGKTRMILNGVSTLDEVEDRKVEKADGRFAILAAGQYHERKGHAVLLEAFARARIGDAVLRLIGEPPPHLRELIRRLGISDRVEWLPEMPNADLLRLMAGSDLFALPSWSESFGLVFMESLGACTPVIMTSDCGAAGHIMDGTHGWIVPPRDAAATGIAIERAYAIGRDHRVAMGRAGRKLVLENFTWKQNAQSVAHALDDRHRHQILACGKM